MEDKNCELLFEYLRSILYDPSPEKLDISQLEPQFQKLGKGLRYLDKAVREMKEYSAALSKGILSGFYPGRDNFLCENLKNLHANLNHLTWQAKQVANGDYSQTVSYLGEFSDAFNTMTEQLREREMRLKEETEKEKARVTMLESYNELLMELICFSEEKIMVLSADTHEILYCNHAEYDRHQEKELYEMCVAMEKEQECQKVSETIDRIWEAKDSHERDYRITTGWMLWQGQRAYVHIIREVTEEKKREEELEDQAYTDILTGIGNRFYFRVKAGEMLKRSDKMVLCYCDLDHLKYINDQFGHAKGDQYLKRFADLIRGNIREGDIFARIGGDEFCILFGKCSKEVAEKKMLALQQLFETDWEGVCPSGFSYGCVEIAEGTKSIRLEEILQKADAEMYQQKRIRKAEYMKLLK